MARAAASADAQLRRLGELRAQPVSDELCDAAAKGLQAKSNLVVAKAAVLAREKRLRELIPQLLERFERLISGPAEADKGCEAKIAIVTALHELECDDPAAFLKGVRHVQWEMAYGAPKNRVDTGATLRAFSAVALARTRYRNVLEELLPLLLDAEPNVRVAAAQAIGAAGRIEGQLLLRFKVLAGDSEADVVTECLGSLLSMCGRDCIDFVTDCLNSDDNTRRSAAALALGASRISGAFELLRSRFEGTDDPEFRSVLLVAIATSREEAATAFLLSLVSTAPARTAVEAIGALRVHQSDDRLREQVMKLLRQRGEPSLDRAAREVFG